MLVIVAGYVFYLTVLPTIWDKCFNKVVEKVESVLRKKSTAIIRSTDDSFSTSLSYMNRLLLIGQAQYFRTKFGIEI